jgi:hypothetical protein
MVGGLAAVKGLRGRVWTWLMGVEESNVLWLRVERGAAEKGDLGLG